MSEANHINLFFCALNLLLGSIVILHNVAGLKEWVDG